MMLSIAVLERDRPTCDPKRNTSLPAHSFFTHTQHSTVDRCLDVVEDTTGSSAVIVFRRLAIACSSLSRSPLSLVIFPGQQMTSTLGHRTQLFRRRLRMGRRRTEFRFAGVKFDLCLILGKRQAGRQCQK